LGEAVKCGRSSEKAPVACQRHREHKLISELRAYRRGEAEIAPRLFNDMISDLLRWKTSAAKSAKDAGEELTLQLQEQNIARPSRSDLLYLHPII